MKIENDDLKKTYLAYISSKILGNPNKCPSPIVLFNSFSSSTSLRNKKRVISHITGCSFCREEFDLLLELQRYHASSTTVINETSSTPDKLCAASFRKSLIGRYAYFLLGLLLILFAYYFNAQQYSLIEIKRTSEQRILLITPAQVHTFPKPLIFKWQEESVSQYYILELFDNSLLPVWTSQRILDVQTQLPEDILSHLQTGNYYFWMVSAFSSTQKISESELMRFLVLKK
jgi:hypothetical protein